MFYNACLARERGDLLSNATAARVAQADMKGWKDFTKDMQQAMKSLVSPKSDAAKSTRSNKAMEGFFSTLAKAKGKNQQGTL